MLIRQILGRIYCISKLHSVNFTWLLWCPKLMNLLEFESYFGRKDAVLTIRGSDILSEALPMILIYLREVRKYTQELMNVCP